MLEISLLGEITIRIDGEPVTHFRSQTELAMLAYLAHAGGAQNREALADLLWDARSTKQSLSNLRTALARLRQQVGDQLVVTRKTVALAPAVHEQTDSVRLPVILAGAGEEPSLTGSNLLAQGLALYRGEFMAGFALARAPRFNDWLVVEQERLRQVAMNGYRRLAGWQEEQGAFAAGAATAQKWVAWDPLDETAQQQLLRLLAYDGRAAEALRVYERYRELLQTELAVSPAAATTALVASIRDGSLRPPEIAPTIPHNLPRALTPLFGRTKEIAAISSVLLDPVYPLVSITGAGGMGKTSLALAAGRHILAQEEHPFRDGIWFISLEVIEPDSAGSISEAVAAAAGQALGLYFHGESDLWSQLLGQIAAKKLLLIIDNIEQFLAAATDLIVELLEAGQGVHLLVTSRTALALGASVAFPLTGLETPQALAPEAANSASVRLFAERAARMPVPFALEKHLAEVVAICQFVEGMPLGIELAAASLGRLMMDEIMPALTSNLHLLDSTRRDLPSRQRTLQAVFDYSWQLLDAREQSLLAQISIFRGGFTRQAAEAVLADRSSGLYNLQYHALLSRSETGRFQMHPLVRQLAQEKLNSPKMAAFKQQAVERHSKYYAGLVGSFADDLQRGVGQEAIQDIVLERANLHAAWQYAVQAAEWRSIAACLDSAHTFFQRQGFFAEETALVDGAIAALESLAESHDPYLTGLLSHLLSVRARGLQRAAKFEEGLRVAERACSLAQRLEDPELEARARLAWGRILSTQHRRELALAQFEQVVALAKTAKNQFLEANGWTGIGGQMLWRPDVKTAREPLQRALELCRMLNYKPGELETLILLADQASREQAFAESFSFKEQALQLACLLGDVVAEAEVLGSMGVNLAALNDLAGAQSYDQEALAIFRRLNMPESEAWVLGELGYATLLLGDYATAERRLNDALAIATRHEDTFWQGWVKLRLGEIGYEQGQTEKALSFISESLQIAEQFQYLNFRARVLYDWGVALLGQGDWANAALKFEEAFDFRHGSGRIKDALPSLAGLAYAAYQQGLLQTAADAAEQLWQTWQESPAMAERANLRLYWMLGEVWHGLGDQRAGDLWEKARALLQERSQKIADERGRRMYLEQVPANRAILKGPN